MMVSLPQRTAWVFSILFALAVLAPIAPPARAAMAENDQRAFGYFAERLLAGIGAAKFSDIPAIGGYGRPRIAVLPFSSEEAELPPSVASELNNHLLTELIRQGSRSYRFVAREALKSIIKEIDAIGELDPGNDGRVKDLLRNARVDILIVGRLRADDSGFVLSYQAVSVEDGTLFAATGPRHVSGLSRYAATQSSPLDPHEAMRQVAWSFARALGDEAILSVEPIGQAPDGAATPMGEYLTELLADSLRYRLHRPDQRGARVRIESAGPTDTNPRHARIKGRYWDLGHSLEIRLVLHRGDGSTIPWRRLVSARGLPGVAPSLPAEPEVTPAPRPPVARVPLDDRPLPGADPIARPRVREAQRLLTELGYQPGPVDGVLRLRTRAALRAFQRDQGLEDHGRLTRRVMQRLRRSWRQAEIAL